MHSVYQIRLIGTLLLLLLSLLQVQAQDEPAVADTLMEEIISVTPPDEAEADTALFNTAQQKPVEVREVNKKAVEALKKDEAFWYANLKPQKEEPSIPFWKRGWVKTLMWIIIIASFVAVILLFLSSSNVFLFRRRSKKIAAEEERGELQEDIHTLDFDSELKKALTKEDYRLAIRYLYLKKLKELSDAGLIQYRQERTNQDYVMQLFGSAHYKDFFRLTRHFEYAWYGKFTIAADHFKTIRAQFDGFKTGKAA